LPVFRSLAFNLPDRAFVCFVQFSVFCLIMECAATGLHLSAASALYFFNHIEFTCRKGLRISIVKPEYKYRSTLQNDFDLTK